LDFGFFDFDFFSPNFLTADSGDRFEGGFTFFADGLVFLKVDFQ